ncbi:hypothetical protein TNCV_2344981 [Trichonephila clavipes]|nr:hypothetical protein TNCV_2344981 [Trichonephila clavipes]
MPNGSLRTPDRMLMMNRSRRRNAEVEITQFVNIAVTEYGLALSSNNKTPELRNPGFFFRITSFNFGHGITIPRVQCDTLVPTSKKSPQNTNSQKSWNSCPLEEDDLIEFMTFYDNKELDDDEVEGEVQLLMAKFKRA